MGLGSGDLMIQSPGCGQKMEDSKKSSNTQSEHCQGTLQQGSKPPNAQKELVIQGFMYECMLMSI